MGKHFWTLAGFWFLVVTSLMLNSLHVKKVKGQQNIETNPKSYFGGTTAFYEDISVDRTDSLSNLVGGLTMTDRNYAWVDRYGKSNFDSLRLNIELFLSVPTNITISDYVIPGDSILIMSDAEFDDLTRVLGLLTNTVWPRPFIDRLAKKYIHPRFLKPDSTKDGIK